MPNAMPLGRIPYPRAQEEAYAIALPVLCSSSESKGKAWLFIPCKGTQGRAENEGDHCTSLLTSEHLN